MNHLFLQKVSRLVFLGSILFAWSSFGMNVDRPEVVSLWPAGAAPGLIEVADANAVQDGHVSRVDEPRLWLFRPERATSNGAAVLICPGGGYGTLAYHKEGSRVAEWLNQFGVTGVVLFYRHAPYRHPVPLGDAQRAMRTIRAHAREWGVDPARVGVMGFSAGGHLAGSLATHYDTGIANATDAVDQQSCRPDFQVLVYPVVSMREGTTHGGSRRNLLGESPGEALVEAMSSERQVDANTPPAFLVHAGDDRTVPMENSLRYYEALQEAGVPAELHVFPRGGHGFGLGVNGGPVTQWPGLCETWLRESGFMK